MRPGYGEAGKTGAKHHLPLIACIFCAIGNVFCITKPLDYNSGPERTHD